MPAPKIPKIYSTTIKTFKYEKQKTKEQKIQTKAKNTEPMYIAIVWTTWQHISWKNIIWSNCKNLYISQPVIMVSPKLILIYTHHDQWFQKFTDPFSCYKGFEVAYHSKLHLIKVKLILSLPLSRGFPKSYTPECLNLYHFKSMAFKMRKIVMGILLFNRIVDFVVGLM